MALMRLGGNIMDDAGNPVKLLDPAGMSEWPGKGDERIDALVTRIRRAMTVTSPVEWVLGIVVALAVISAVVVLRPMVNRLMPQIPGFVYFIAVMLGAKFLGQGLWRARLHMTRDRVAGIILEEGLCPGCGYNFAGLNAADLPATALVTCPECGAAWRRARIERIEPFRADVPTAAPVGRISKPMPRANWSTRDDRGLLVKLAHPCLRSQLAARQGTAGHERLLNARRTLAAHRRWVRRSAVVFLVACMFLAVATVLAGSMHPMAAIVLFVVCLFLALAAGLGNFAYNPRFVRSTLLKHHLCAMCAADRCNEPASPRDGCTVCPACRSAWTLEKEPASG